MSAVYFLLTALLVSAAGIASYNTAIALLMDSRTKRTARDPQTGVLKGAEPVFLKGSDKKAVLLVHGFIGTPTDFGRLARLLHEAGYTVFAPLLPGHGTDPRDFDKTTSEELIEFVGAAYRQMKKNYEEVILAGFSMGGALSMITAARENPRRLILLAPYFKIAHQWFYVLPAEFYNKVFTSVIPFVYRPLYFKQIRNKSAIPYIIDYSFVAQRGGRAAIDLGQKALGLAGSIRSETLVIHSKYDRATDFRTTQKAVALMRADKTRFVPVGKSNHILLWDYDAPQVEQEILDFLKKTNK